MSRFSPESFDPTADNARALSDSDLLDFGDEYGDRVGVEPDGHLVELIEPLDPQERASREDFKQATLEDVAAYYEVFQPELALRAVINQIRAGNLLPEQVVQRMLEVQPQEEK